MFVLSDAGVIDRHNVCIPSEIEFAGSLTVENQAAKGAASYVNASGIDGSGERKWIALANKILAAGLHPDVYGALFEREDLLDAARAATGFRDFGPMDFIEPLDLLLDGYEQTSALNPIGRLAGRWYLMRLLCNRLRFESIWQTDRHVDSRAVHRPIFILGLPRTGSTLLHEVLSLHPALRAPSYWESTFTPGHDPMDLCRTLAAAGQISLVNRMAPDLKGIHRLGARLPHECVTIQAHTMRSIQFHAAHRVCAYNEWLQTCDWEPAYRWHRRYLKVLQRGGSEARWLLKAPGHMLGLKALDRAYPDATFIQLHRDPAEVIPSMASLSAALRAAFTDSVDESEIGRDTTDQWSLGLTNTLRLRKQHTELDSRFIDIHYTELASRPIEVVGRILDFTGVSVTTTLKRMVEHYLSRNKKGRYGHHEYSLSRFALERSDLDASFADYRAQHLRT